MSVFSRMKDMTKATLNEWLDQLEEPVMMLNQYIRDMEQELSSAELALARQLGMEKRTKMLLDETKQKIEKRQRQAQLAVEHGQEDIARQALQEKLYAEDRLAQYEKDYQLLTQQSQQLRKELQDLKDVYYEMKNKRNTLIARANLAKASQKINEAIRTGRSDTAARGFARMEERILAMEIEAQVSESLRVDNTPDPRVENELAQLKTSAV